MWPEVRHQLMWIEHGGSGYSGMSWEQVNEIDVVDLGWLYERMRQQRHDEAEAIKRGGRGK